jgi:hypothetical protein
MKRIIVIIALSVLASTVWAGTNGGTAGAFARIGAGARARGMGNAFVAVAQGAAAVYFNAGALPYQTRREFSATTLKMALDRRLDYLAFSAPIHPKPAGNKKPVNGGVGIGWLHASVGDIDSRDFDGNPLPMINMSSNQFLFGFGIEFHEKFGAGVTAKVVYETYGKIGTDDKSVNGDGFGIDAAAFSRPIEHLTVGAQIKDIGTKTTWNTANYWSQGTSKIDKWPAMYRVGAAYERWGLTGALDVESSAEKETKLHAGAEYLYPVSEKQSVAGRIGYDAGSPTFGLGIGFRIWKLESTLDFTYVIENIAPDDGTTVSWGVSF